MAVLWFAYLVDSISDALPDLSNSNRDLKLLIQMAANLFREISGTFYSDIFQTIGRLFGG